jgi:D-xylose reductase
VHPFNTAEKLNRFCRESGVQMMAYSNLGVSSYVELGQTGDSCLDLQLIKDIATKYKKTPAQIVLRWGVQRGTTIIPKTSKKERLAENIDLFNFSLTSDEVKSIDNLNQDKKFNDPGNYAEPAFKQFYPIWE